MLITITRQGIKIAFCDIGLKIKYMGDIQLLKGSGMKKKIKKKVVASRLPRSVKATKTVVVKPISAKTRKDVTHLLHQTGVLKGGYLPAPADHQYEVTGDLNQLRLTLIQMTLTIRSYVVFGTSEINQETDGTF